MGLPFVIVGEAIRIWATGYLTKMAAVITAGPFALCRNPLYVGSFFITMGYFVISNRLDVWIIGTVLFWLFHGGAIIYEEKMLLEKFGDEYAEYCKVTPRLIPHSFSLKGNGSFSFDQIMRNNEYRGFAGAALIVVIFTIMAISHKSPIDLIMVMAMKP